MTEDNSILLPDGWVCASLESVVTAQAGVGFPKAMQGETDGDYPFVKVSDISRAVSGSEGIVSTAANYLSEAGAKRLRARVFPPGSTLFAKIGEAVRLNRRAITSVPVLADNNVMGLLPCEELVTPKYVLYFMQTIDLGDYTRATTVPSVRKTDVAQIAIPLAPLSEQYRIVAEIETQFTRLDAGVAALKRAQANLRRYRASVLMAACEGRLVPTEAELARAEGREYEPAKVLLEQILAERRARWEEGNAGKRYKEPVSVDASELPELPDGWVWSALDMLSYHITSGSRGWAKYYSDHGSMFIRAQDIKTDTLDLEHVAFVQLPLRVSVEGTRTRVFEGDLLVTITGANVTKTALVRQPLDEAFVSQHVGLVRPTDGEMRQYLYFWIVAPTHGRWFLEQEAYGAGKPGLNLTNLRELGIALPPMAEQDRIVAEIERRLSVVEELEKQVKVALKRADRLRQAILKHAFEGKLVSQDPDDEPATVLLERIRAQRAAEVGGDRGKGKPRQGRLRGA